MSLSADRPFHQQMKNREGQRWQLMVPCELLASIIHYRSRAALDTHLRERRQIVVLKVVNRALT